MLSRFGNILLILLASTLAVGPRTEAATLEVNPDGSTPYQAIQAAINAAIPGADEVFVHCGTYHENIVMRDQVSLRGAGAGCTVIDGGQNGSVVTINGIGSTTDLEGFTITNGRNGLGGGIYLEQSSVTITRNVIVGNTAPITAALTGYGGGIHVTSPVALRATTAPTITRNIIRNNWAERFGGGIEIYSDEGLTLANNLILENTAAEGGGGVDVFNSFPTIVNNTIVRNCLQGGPQACASGGGGIAMTLSGVVGIANNILAWNEAGSGGGGLDLITSSATFSSNDAYQNLPVDYSGVSDPTGSNGNISADPLFAGQQANFYGFQPRSHSPLVEGGSATLAPAQDLLGLTRPLDGDADGTALHDIGARVNEGVTSLAFQNATDVSWDPSGDALALFNLYRGELQRLRDTGEYTQDPVLISGARRWRDLGAPSAVDLDRPDPGQTLFYLAVVTNVVEGILGFDSDGSARSFVAANRRP